MSLVLAGIAWACKCESPLAFVMPPEGATGVPVNARIWVGEPSIVDATLRLLGPDGGEVATARSAITAFDGTLVVLTPDAPLEPYTAYALEACDPLEDCIRWDGFRTGADDDGDVPSVPAEVARETVGPDRSGGSCGHDQGVRLEVDAAGADLLVLDVGGAATLEPDAPSGDVTRVQTDLERVSVGEIECDRTWVDVRNGADTEVRLGAFDVSGNWSGWSEPISVTYCGCASSGPGRPPAWFGAAAALLVGWRRRAMAARERRVGNGEPSSDVPPTRSPALPR